MLLSEAVAGLGADAGTVGLVNRSRTDIELAGASATRRRASPPGSTSRSTPSCRCRGRSARQARLDHVGGRAPGALPPLRESSAPASLAVIPLAVEGALRGPGPQLHRPPRIRRPGAELPLAAAQQAAQTLDRARLYEAQRLVSERLSYLAEASELLAALLDPDASLRQLADLAVRRVADWCGIELVDEDGDLRNVAVAHTDPSRLRLAEELRARYPVDPDAEIGAPQVIRTGESELHSEISDEMLVEAARDEEHLRLMRELGIVSAMVVPLRARGRSLGAMTLVAAESGRHFDRGDLALAEDLARRAGLAIDNAMLFRREHEAAVTCSARCCRSPCRRSTGWSSRSATNRRRRDCRWGRLVRGRRLRGRARRTRDRRRGRPRDPCRLGDGAGARPCARTWPTGGPERGDRAARWAPQGG